MRASGAPFASLLLLLAVGCDSQNPGKEPLPSQLNFPIAVEAWSATAGGTPSHLIVVSSNFDLTYNAGSAITFSLDAVESELSAQVLPTNAAEDPVILAPSTVVTSEVYFGSHASAMAMSSDLHRVYLSVRSDSNLTYLDIDDAGVLHCNEDAQGHCDDAHRRGDDVTANPRRLTVPLDPTGIAVGDIADLGGGVTGDYIITSHRAGAASLFVDTGAGAAPLLVHVLDELPPGAINIAVDPDTHLAWLPTIDVNTTTRDNFIGRIGVAIDPRPELSFLYDAGDAILNGLNTGEDTRDVYFDDTLIAGSRLAYLLTRSPEALVIVDLDRSTASRLFVRDVVSLGFGPSRIQVADIPVAETGTTRRLVFVSCFDSRDVWIIDPLTAEVVTVARTLTGPYQLAIDAARRRMYVGDFRSSVVWIVSLEPLVACLGGARPIISTPEGDVEGSCEPFRIASIGDPRPVKELF